MPALDVRISNQISITGAPPPFARIVKGELTFDNPAYLEAEQFGRYTRGIPKKIKSFQEEGKTLSLPRGYQDRLSELLEEHNLESVFHNDTNNFPEVLPEDSLQMWDYQEPWVESMLEHTHGVGVAPPGAGKTIMGLELYARLGQPCLWITHTGRLARQARARAESFLGVETGIIGKGKEEVKHFTVGMVQTLIRRDLSELKDQFGLIIVDECHHVPANTFIEVVSAFNAQYLYGLTATPYRDDGLERLIFHCLGPQRAYLDKEELRELGKLMTPTVKRRPTKFDFPYNPSSRKHGYHSLCKALAEDYGRNAQIVTDVIIESSFDSDNVCIVLVNTIAHGEELHAQISEVLPEVGIVHSRMTTKQGDAVLDDFESGKLRVLVATYQMLAEGFDYQPSNRLFLTAPVKGRTRILQACGRIERVSPGKRDAIVYDYVDQNVSVLDRQAFERLEVYSADNTPTVVVK